jgi:hydrogenase nickel incorporation protein HypA/HybF
MHELSIAISIVEMATEEAERRGMRVGAVHLKVGRLSGVVTDALRSAYELAAEGTPLERSRLVVEDVPIVVFCPACGVERTLEREQWFVCGTCQTPTPEVRHGRELEVVALEAEA